MSISHPGIISPYEHSYSHTQSCKQNRTQKDQLHVWIQNPLFTVQHSFISQWFYLLFFQDWTSIQKCICGNHLVKRTGLVGQWAVFIWSEESECVSAIHCLPYIRDVFDVAVME